MPDKCLHDIGLAKASNYPADLRTKLDDRAVKCQALKAQNVQPNLGVIREPALSFWQHEQHAGVADCLEILQNDELGSHIRTVCDLDIGQIVLVEQPFSIVPTKFSIQNRNRCFYCFKQLKNFITCSDCLKGFYCDVDCMAQARHQIVCSMDVIVDEKEQNEIELVVRTLLNINAAFDDANILLKVVDLLLQHNDLPNDLTPAQRNFCMLFNLPNVMHGKCSDAESKELKRKSAATYDIIAAFPEIEQKFSTTELKIFMQHLILHLFGIVGYAIDLYAQIRSDSKPFMASYSTEHYACAFYPVGCQINHSCIPNVAWFCAGNRLVCTVIRPIQKGEQLLRSYW